MNPADRKPDLLLPCPFCGRAPRKPEHYMMDNYWWTGCCNDAHPVIEFRAETEERVINAWNKRPAHEEHRRALTEKVVEAARSYTTERSYQNVESCRKDQDRLECELIAALSALEEFDAKEAHAKK